MAYEPAWGSISLADASKLGLAGQATVEEAIALCERRGVLVKEGQVDRQAFDLLAKLLAGEKSLARQAVSDFVRWSLALPYIEKAMVSPIEVTPEPEPPKPRQPESWESRRYVDRRRQPKRQNVPSDWGSGFVERCQAVGLSYDGVPDNMAYANEKWCRGFELYAILDINVDQAKLFPRDRRYNGPTKLSIYSAMQTHVYDNVIGGR
jgi:hypothetical protein